MVSSRPTPHRAPRHHRIELRREFREVEVAVAVDEFGRAAVIIAPPLRR
jgi:hypothetical protein